MNELTGLDNVTLDDTGRISLPRNLRDVLGKDNVWLTKGSASCLWLFTPDQWEVMKETIIDSTNSVRCDICTVTIIHEQQTYSLIDFQ